MVIFGFFMVIFLNRFFFPVQIEFSTEKLALLKTRFEQNRFSVENSI